MKKGLLVLALTTITALMLPIELDAQCGGGATRLGGGGFFAGCAARKAARQSGATMMTAPAVMMAYSPATVETQMVAPVQMAVPVRRTIIRQTNCANGSCTTTMQVAPEVIVPAPAQAVPAQVLPADPFMISNQRAASVLAQAVQEKIANDLVMAVQVQMASKNLVLATK